MRQRWRFAGSATNDESVVLLHIDQVSGDSRRLVVVDAAGGVEWRDHRRKKPSPILRPGETAHDAGVYSEPLAVGRTDWGARRQVPRVEISRVEQPTPRRSAG